MTTPNKAAVITADTQDNAITPTTNGLVGTGLANTNGLANAPTDTKPATAAAAEPQDPVDTDEHWVTVRCPIPAFKGVTIEVNVLADTEEMNALTNQLRNGQPQNMVRNVQGWNEKRHNKLFSPKAPMIFIVWITRNAVGDAMNEYLADPNLSTP